MKVGILSISGKPVHLGHQCIIERASKENDQVVLFVSISNRERRGEIKIFGEDMKIIWEDFLENIMPPNVHIIYGGSPIRQAYSTLGNASEQKLKNTYTIYGDPNDLAKNFPNDALKKYADYLWGNGQIKLLSIPRTETVNISSTQMRKFLETGEKEIFIKYLPRGVDKEAIWEILHNRIKKY